MKAVFGVLAKTGKQKFSELAIKALKMLEKKELDVILSIFKDCDEFFREEEFELLKRIFEYLNPIFIGVIWNMKLNNHQSFEEIDQFVSSLDLKSDFLQKNCFQKIFNFSQFLKKLDSFYLEKSTKTTDDLQELKKQFENLVKTDTIPDILIEKIFNKFKDLELVIKVKSKEIFDAQTAIETVGKRKSQLIYLKQKLENTKQSLDLIDPIHGNFQKFYNELVQIGTLRSLVENLGDVKAPKELIKKEIGDLV